MLQSINFLSMRRPSVHLQQNAQTIPLFSTEKRIEENRLLQKKTGEERYDEEWYPEKRRKAKVRKRKGRNAIAMLGCAMGVKV